jgi:hypothetical protein
MQLVASAAKMTQREIPARVALTDYQPHTNIAAHTEAELEAAGLMRLKTKLKPLVGRLKEVAEVFPNLYPRKIKRKSG